MGFLDDITLHLFDSPGQGDNEKLRKDGKDFGYLGANPYQTGWDSLISQLQARAAGKNSLAERQVRDVAAAGMNQQVAMSRGSSAGAARAGTLGASHITQGLENSAGQARLAESQASQAALQNALSGAGNAQFSRDAANQAMYGNAVHDAMGQQSTAQKIAGTAAQIGAAASGAGAFTKPVVPTAAKADAPTSPQPPAQAADTHTYAPVSMMSNQDPLAGALQDDPRYRSPMYSSPYNTGPGGYQNPYAGRYS